MNPERYQRQTILKEFGPQAQQKLLEAKVLVVGAGGLGVPVLTYLNAMGVGTLGIVDADEISLSNLHRQVLYNEEEVGQSKVSVSLKKLKDQNSGTNLVAHDTFLTRENALRIVKEYDLVVDATDNFPTRYLINDSCVILKKPIIYGALHGFEGQVSVFNHKGGPTYRCLFPSMPSPEEIPNCNEHGVLGIVPGIIGNLQALEAVKVLTGVGEVLSGKLLLFNGLAQSFQKIKFSAVPANLKIQALQKEYELHCKSDTATIAAEAFEKLMKTDDIQAIDVRTIQEYQEFHIKNTSHCPLAEIEDWKMAIDFSKPIYLICQSGIRSQKALSILHEYKPTAILFNVNGGINKLNTYVAKY
ncbi:MAG: HesA/MoeB/ThiF family protein [Maribacter sp.]|nr:HesA/MoeB/ThiF family protein [Maribacter sp.]